MTPETPHFLETNAMRFEAGKGCSQKEGSAGLCPGPDARVSGMITSPSAATLIFHTDPFWRDRLAKAVAANLSFVLAAANRDAVDEVEAALIDIGVEPGRYDVFFDRLDDSVQGLLY
jgi:hypothetical protein